MRLVKDRRGRADRSVPRPVQVLEDVAPHLVALRDAFVLVEAPVDAEVDAALAVLFLRFGQRGETARPERTRVALVVLRDAVELVRYERERDVVGTVELAQHLEQRASEDGVPGRIRREGRR